MCNKTHANITYTSRKAHKKKDAIQTENSRVKKERSGGAEQRRKFITIHTQAIHIHARLTRKEKGEASYQRVLSFVSEFFHHHTQASHCAGEAKFTKFGASFVFSLRFLIYN